MKAHRTRVLALAILAISLPALLHAQSFDELRQRARRGDAAVQFELGARYSMGEEVVLNLSEAMKWYRRAAKGGDARAQYQLGIGYADGMLLRQSRTKAVKWLRRAAQQENAAAQSVLKEMNENW